MVRKENKMNNNTEKRWGVYAWSRLEDGSVEARINNTFKSEEEAKEAAESSAFRYGYDSRVIVPQEHFRHAWAMIGAMVGSEEVSA